MGTMTAAGTNTGETGSTSAPARFTLAEDGKWAPGYHARAIHDRDRPTPQRNRPATGRWGDRPLPTPLTTNRSIEAATECRGGAFSG
jgi:hypothetical protein